MYTGFVSIRAFINHECHIYGMSRETGGLLVTLFYPTKSLCYRVAFQGQYALWEVPQSAGYFVSVPISASDILTELWHQLKPSSEMPICTLWFSSLLWQGDWQTPGQPSCWSCSAYQGFPPLVDWWLESISNSRKLYWANTNFFNFYSFMLKSGFPNMFKYSF